MLSPPTVIDVHNMVKTFDTTNAVDGISFTVPKGSVTALLGGNGAGKTTTLSMLLGLLLPTSGSIHIFGEDMVADRFKVLERMNFSSPYVDLPQRLTTRENLTVYGGLYGVPGLKNRIAELADDLDLNDFIDRPAKTLSAGQKTRLALAKALLNKPELLLLDEPTASLDPDTGDRLRQYFEDYRDRTGATILLASHNMGEVERLCDQVLMMRTGQIVDQGSPTELVEKHGRQNMEEVFLHIARSGEESEKTEAST